MALSRPEDTEVVTTEATALGKGPPSASASDADPTAPEVDASAKSPSVLDPAEQKKLDLVLWRLWRRWTGLVGIIVKGCGPSGVNGDRYRTIYNLLLQACRTAVDTAPTPQGRAFYQELLSIVQPWLNLKTFIHTEEHMLEALWKRCKQAELELNNGKVPWTIGQVIGLILLTLSPVGLVVWYVHYGRLGLAALARSFNWDGSTTSLRSLWAFVTAHPALFIGVLFPLVIIFSIYLLARTPRT